MKKKLYKFITYLVFIYCIVYSYNMLETSKFFHNFKTSFLIKIHCNSDIHELQSFLDELKNQYIWNVNANDLKVKLLLLQHVKTASVKVVLPNMIYISVKNRIPYAIWWDYKKFFLVDDEGVILSDNITMNDKKRYLLIVGEAALQNLKNISNVIAESKQNGKVVSMRFIGYRRWDIVLNDGTIIKLPEKNLAQALTLFDKLNNLSSKIITHNSIVDMRLMPDKVFVKNLQD